MKNLRHHFPSNTNTRNVMRVAYLGTKELYEKIFGETPNNVIWPEAGKTCGDSYSGLVDENTAALLLEQRSMNIL